VSADNARLRAGEKAHDPEIGHEDAPILAADDHRVGACLSAVAADCGKVRFVEHDDSQSMDELWTMRDWKRSSCRNASAQR
jgi:hypothetical protein